MKYTLQTLKISIRNNEVESVSIAAESYKNYDEKDNAADDDNDELIIMMMNWSNKKRSNAQVIQK